MSRKIKVQTVNTDNLEKILKENICTKTLESGISPALIEKTRKLMDKLREEDNNPCNNDNTGDASASTKIELGTYDYYAMTDEYINKVIIPILKKVDKEKTDNIDSNVLSDFQSILVSLFKDYDIKSYKESLLNEKLMHEIEANLISFNFKENLVDHERFIKFLSERTPETLCQQLLKRYPNLKEKTFALIKDNNPLEESELNRISVNTDFKNKDIQNSKKYVEEHIIPRKKALKRINDLSSSIKNLDNIGEFVISIPQDYETTMEEINNMKNNNTECNTHYEEVNHPDHYNVYDVEVVEMMERIFGIEETMSWCKLNAFKYRMRAGEKPTSTVEKDLKKEKWCLNKYKELKSKN